MAKRIVETTLSSDVRVISAGEADRHQFVMESKHPYEKNTNEYYPVKVPGAVELRILFDSKTRTASGSDFVVFHKDCSCAESWGQEYSGRENGNWPGKSKKDGPLIIAADSFVLHWKTDSMHDFEWGWKITIEPIFPGDMQVKCQYSAQWAIFTRIFIVDYLGMHES